MVHSTPSVARIVEVFRDLGGATTTEHLAAECLRRGVVDPKPIAALQNDIRRALRSGDASGLPWAGPTAESLDSAPIWKLRALWSEADYHMNIALRLQQAEALDTKAHQYANECRERFGIAPDVFTVSPN